MMLTARTFLKLAAGGFLVSVGGRLPGGPRSVADGSSLAVVGNGFFSFAAALACARHGVSDVRWHIREDRLLAGWLDGTRFKLTGTGLVENGCWRRTARGLCLEFMLRMEIRGPVAATPRPRPGRVWEPVYEVSHVRALMERMLVESGVALVCGDAGVPAWEPPAVREMHAADFDRGQYLGVLTALRGKATPAEIRAVYECDLSLPG